ncbi:hypothetical protein RXV86_02735 [Alisedimentitalea sp. MJ-SS2]|uniref:hypothetical protein n=1 Tax=Aliisedimentitalea sp. MJ-SS2 TaxID=3049795 RepID=UPI00290DC1DF|nr:hypothetical protein [Alisedimentitalea sp. MJ-SS2]MDU8926291.1 hypothetical protein [Alisedimentitalea sp. MJ-SS2]
MLSDLLLSFFFGMPAIVAVVIARDLKNLLPRAMLFWGGWVAVICVALVIIPMLGCDGHLMKAHKACIGGTGMAAFFNNLNPISTLAAKLYILAGIPLAILAYLIESTQNRRAA